MNTRLERIEQSLMVLTEEVKQLHNAIDELHYSIQSRYEELRLVKEIHAKLFGKELEPSVPMAGVK